MARTHHLVDIACPHRLSSNHCNHLKSPVLYRIAVQMVKIQKCGMHIAKFNEQDSFVKFYTMGINRQHPAENEVNDDFFPMPQLRKKVHVKG
jgi:hypothetical protein